jgi:hypothetical protein
LWDIFEAAQGRVLDAKGAEETKLGRLEKGEYFVGRWGFL